MNDSNIGVYYKLSDYAGLWRRIIIFVTDTIVLYILLMIVSTMSENTNDSYGYWYLGYIVFILNYLTLMKSSRFRTLGYRITKTKIVTLD